jgi:serine/threonine protein kinase
MSAYTRSPTATCSPGRLVGNYRLVRQLGQGGFATVYLGTHRYLGTHAAIKIVSPHLPEAQVSTFLAEARLAARLVHPSIVRVLECGLEREMPFLVMDYAPGGTVRQHYPRGSRLAPHVILAYTEHIAQAVRYLHGRELIHRDIKPENLLLGSNHQLLLSDFGITIAAHQAEGDEQTRVGTIAYMGSRHVFPPFSPLSLVG